MEFGDFRHKVRRIAFFTISSWIILTTIVVVMMIWDAIEDTTLSNVVWTATAITIGVLLGCITYFGFASAEEEAHRRANSTESDDDSSEQGHLRKAFDKAKIT